LESLKTAAAKFSAVFDEIKTNGSYIRAVHAKKGAKNAVLESSSKKVNLLLNDRDLSKAAKAKIMYWVNRHVVINNTSL